MKDERISVLCIQETHLTGSECFESAGFTLFLSGAEAILGERDYAGVGFLVAPWARKSVISFRAISSRVAALRLKVHGALNL